MIMDPCRMLTVCLFHTAQLCDSNLYNLHGGLSPLPCTCWIIYTVAWYRETMLLFINNTGGLHEWCHMVNYRIAETNVLYAICILPPMMHKHVEGYCQGWYIALLFYSWCRFMRQRKPYIIYLLYCTNNTVFFLVHQTSFYTLDNLNVRTLAMTWNSVYLLN